MKKGGFIQIYGELLICDSEEDYAKKLSEAILLCEETFQVRLCASLEMAEKLLGIGHVQVVLISEDFPLQRRNQIQGTKRIVLARSHCVDLGENETELMKYQPIDKLMAGILKICRENLRFTSRAAGGTSRILGVYSPIHRIGKTTFAVKLGKLLAEKENVLYLNLESYAGIGGYFHKHDGQDLSHLLYYARQESGEFSERIAAMVRRKGQLDYIPPMKVWTDLQSVTIKEWKSFLEKLVSQSIYRIVILDIGNAVADVFSLLQELDIILIPTVDDVQGKAKLAQYRYILEVLHLQELELRSIYVDMKKTMRQAVTEAKEEIEQQEERTTGHAEIGAASRRGVSAP